MTVVTYEDRHHSDVLDLVLHVQNAGYAAGIDLEEQPDILDITTNYVASGGNF